MCLLDTTNARAPFSVPFGVFIFAQCSALPSPNAHTVTKRVRAWFYRSFYPFGYGDCPFRPSHPVIIVCVPGKSCSFHVLRRRCLPLGHLPLTLCQYPFRALQVMFSIG